MNTQPLVIVLPGFLTEPTIAKALLPNLTTLPKNSAFRQFLNSARPVRIERFDHVQTSPWQIDVLQRCGLAALSQNKCSAALASLYQNTPSSNYSIMGHLCHLQIDTQHAQLSPASAYQLSEELASHLLNIIQPVLQVYQCHVTVITPQLWQFDFEQTLEPIDIPSYDWIQGKDVSTWIQSQRLPKIWRQLHNEIQMLWFQHAQQVPNTPEINFIWPEGGIMPPRSSMGVKRYISNSALIQTLAGQESLSHLSLDDQSNLPTLFQAGDYIVDMSLWVSQQLGDLYRWQETLKQLEERIFAPALATLIQKRTTHIEWVLTDHVQHLVLEHKRPTWATQFFPRNWQSWWLNRA